MLNYLKIKNLALIDNAEVEFFPGFNVVTGESGSGKTVLLNTIGLLTGKRADKNLLRAGCDRCELTAEITVDCQRNPEITAALEAAGIEFDTASGVLQLRRIFTKSGNRNFINDTVVTTATLKSIGELLVDIHSADEHHTLIHRGRQLELLDRFGGLDELHSRYLDKFNALKDLRSERDAALAQLPSESEAAMLKDIAAEIAAVDPRIGEDEELAAKHKLAANSYEILQILQKSRMQLSEGEGSILDNLSDIHRELGQLSRLIGDENSEFQTDLELICENITDLTQKLENFGNSIELDEASFAELEQRLSALYTLKRHYGPNLENVIARWEDAQNKLRIFEGFAQLQTEYKQRIQSAEAELKKAGKALSKARKDAAKVLSDRVAEKLQVLGFEFNVFYLDFAEHEPEISGVDAVDMMFSANPGLNPAPLRLVASSGEIARVMLALKAVLADADAIPVLIFDEIDVNIGGETGLRVGEELANLARHRQLLCISHLPQVAALGEHHFAVSKKIENNIVYGSITQLDNTARAHEISRMLGGTDAALKHAKSLLKK